MQPTTSQAPPSDGRDFNTSLVKFWTTPDYADKLRRIADYERTLRRRRVGKSEIVREVVEPIIDELYSRLPRSRRAA